MTGISSSTGLISGINYQELIDKLIAVDSKTKDSLDERTELLQLQYDALESLQGLLLKSTYMISVLNGPERFNRCDFTSSNESVLTASKNGTPTEGSYVFTPIQTAQGQQTIAAGVASDSTALGKTGTITIGAGWNLERNTSLSEINGGEGFTKGYLRLTDGSGTRASVDLRSASTIEDIVKAINDTHTVDVFAEIVDDRLVLTDMSGVDPSESKFAVADVAGGSTAASLGLAGKTAVDGVVTGDSIYRLGENTKLSSLNNGLGIVVDSLVPDLSIACKDGSTVTVDFSRRSTTAEIEAGAVEVEKELTLGELIDTINHAADENGVYGKIQASISDDGKRLVLTDRTTKMIANPDYDEDAGESESNPAQIEDPTAMTIITQVSTNPVLQSLGFGGVYTAPLGSRSGTFTSDYLIGSLTSPTMSSMHGGQGLSAASAGEIEVQDRAGNTATISFTQSELAQMQTFEQTTELLNEKLADAGIGIKVQMNDAKTGFKLTDTTGQSSANMVFRDKVVTTSEIVENEDGEEETVTNTTDPKIAKTLGLDVNAARSTANGDSLNMQVYSHTTKLSDMNGGAGITLAGGKIVITDSMGTASTITFDAKTHATLGDVIESINRTSAKVSARINDTGDGILLEEYAGGNGSFSVYDADSNSKVASQLGIAQLTPNSTKVNGRLKIDSGQSLSFEVEATDTLDDIRKKINDLGGNFTATIVYDGSDTPYRLAITSKATGAASAMNIDLSCLGLSTENMTEARDAILVFGDASTDSGVELRSSTNTFKNVVNGMDLTVKGSSDTPVTITSEKSSVDIKAALTEFVKNYNTFKEELNTVTYYTVTDKGITGNTLYNNNVAKQMDREIVNMLQKQVSGITGINSLQSLGISVRSSLDDEGTLTTTGSLIFDEDVFDAAYEANPDGVRDFFYQSVTQTDSEGKEIEIKTGWAQTFMTAAEKVTGDASGEILGKVYYEMETIQKKIDQNTSRSEYLQGRLDWKRQHYLMKFANLETSLAKMSSDLSTVSEIASKWASNSSS